MLGFDFWPGLFDVSTHNYPQNDNGSKPLSPVTDLHNFLSVLTTPRIVSYLIHCPNQLLVWTHSTKSSVFWDITPRSRLTFNGLHRVISQKTELFITKAVRTSNPTNLVFSRTLYETDAWDTPSKLKHVFVTCTNMTNTRTCDAVLKSLSSFSSQYWSSWCKLLSINTVYAIVSISKEVLLGKGKDKERGDRPKYLCDNRINHCNSTNSMRASMVAYYVCLGSATWYQVTVSPQSPMHLLRLAHSSVDNEDTCFKTADSVHIWIHNDNVDFVKDMSVFLLEKYIGGIKICWMILFNAEAVVLYFISGSLSKRYLSVRSLIL
jgi:hypothetical protein